MEMSLFIIKKQTVLKAIITLLICLLCILLSVSVVPVQAANNVAKKNVKTHDIAIVFDNSGSMYDNTDRWSQALYAIGVFASMLDYDSGDRLGIYPMSSISIGKNGKSVSDRLEITKENVDKISKIYCKHTSETILEPAYKAKEYLKNSNLYERWLIVLTDGEFYYDKNLKEKKSKKDGVWLNKKLLSMTGNGVNVQYLGFGEASVLQSNISSGFHASNVNDANALTDELINICNKIFQRHKVEGVSNGEFSVDVSMNNVVAFVQGKGVKIQSLKNTKTNNSAETSLDTVLTAGTEGTGSNYSTPRADVSGQVVTYSSCEAGDYKLSFIGSSVEIFYEPNVKIKSYLTNEKGEKVDTSKSIIPGEYTLNYGLIDCVSGEDVTESELLKPVELIATVTNNDSKQTVVSGQKIKLVADSKTKINIKGTYLNEYEIDNEGDETGASINVKPPEAKSLKVSVHTKQFGKWFKLSDKDSWEPIRIDVTYDGKKLTDEQMEKLKLSLEPKSSDDLRYSYKLLKGQSAYEIILGKDKDGKYYEPKCGGYKLVAKATYTDKYGRQISSDDDIKFDIQWFSKFWLWLFWLILLALLIALVIFILNLPAWPARMSCVIEKPRKAKGRISISPSGGTIRLVPYKHELSATVKKNSKLKDKFSKKASIRVVNIAPNKKIQSFSVGSNTYTKANKFLDANGKPFTGVIRNGTQISMTFTTSEPLSSKININ